MSDLFLQKLSVTGPLVHMATQMQDAIEKLQPGTKLTDATSKLNAVTDAISLIDRLFYTYEAEAKRATEVSYVNSKLIKQNNELNQQVKDLQNTIKNLEHE